MYKSYIKRLLDIVLSILTLPIQLIVFIVIAPIIFFEDRGSVFYLSKRRGIDGQIFNLYKYRSMTVNDPEIRNIDDSTWTSDSDTRVTKIGKILRKSSLDELPQILNVLKGDMSFIGPRPNLTKKNLSDFNELERKRVTVRPGITGYSQAYFRNSISSSEKYQYDCYYVDNISFQLDVKIFFKTLSSVLKQKNINAKPSNR